MARQLRFCPAGMPQHVIQRGNNRSLCFVDDSDHAAYSHWLKEYSFNAGVAIHSWVFMSNHVHLLVTPQSDDSASIMMQSLGRRYVRYFNHRHQRTGTLWEGRFRSHLVQSREYLLHCYRYIELNPVRAGMVSDPADYNWSSYRCNALGVACKLCTPHEEYLKLGTTDAKQRQSYRELFNGRCDKKVNRQIRQAAASGMAYGDADFKQKVERTFNRRITPAKMGRPRKSLI